MGSNKESLHQFFCNSLSYVLNSLKNKLITRKVYDDMLRTAINKQICSSVDEEYFGLNINQKKREEVLKLWNKKLEELF